MFAKLKETALVITSRRVKLTFDEFRQPLTATEPPAGLTVALAGLWWDAKGNWKRAQQRKVQFGLERRSLGEVGSAAAGA